MIWIRKNKTAPQYTLEMPRKIQTIFYPHFSFSNALFWRMKCYVSPQMHCYEVWNGMYICACFSFEPICSIKLVNYLVLTIIIQNFIFSCCFNIFWQWWICWQSHCWCIGEDRSWWYNKNWVIIFNIYYSWSAGRNEGTFMLS